MSLARLPKRTLASTIAGIIAAGALAILFSLALLAHDPLVFWNDDFELSILPVCADMARAWSHGEFPLLSPYSWVCGNLAGEFQYGVFSVFMNAVIVVTWKFPLIFSQQAAGIAIAHLAVLAAGGFVLARGRGLSSAHSMLVALVAAFNGWMICWGATDWLGALGAFAWLPWAWWAAERALDSTRSRWRFLWPAPFVYLVITGGFPYTVLMLALVFAWLAVRKIFETRRFTPAWPLFLGGIIGVGLSAPAWLALLDYIHGSARQTTDRVAHFQWLVPASAWPGLILPCWTVGWADFLSRMTPHSATELACGLVAPAVLFSALITNFRALLRRIGWELMLLLILAVLVMLPTAGVFRWSFRWLPLFHLVLAISAAEALRLLDHPGLWKRFARPGIVAAVLVVITAGLMHALGFEGQHAFPLTGIMVALALLWALLELFAIRSELLRNWTPAAISFIALLATYFCIPPNCGVPKYNFGQTLLRPEPLDPARLYLSVYPPPENAYRLEAKPGPVGQTLRPGSTPMWARLRFINGYSPIRPAGVARAFATDIHGEVDPNVAPWLLQYEAGPEGLLARLGVDGIIVARELTFVPQPASEWSMAITTDEGSVYYRRGSGIPAVRSVNFDGKHASASVIDGVNSRNAASAFVEVPGSGLAALVAFSRPFFPGYKAQIAGKELTVTSFRGLIPLVEIPPGTRGRLTLIYRPDWLVVGAAIAAASALVWVGMAMLALRFPATLRDQ